MKKMFSNVFIVHSKILSDIRRPSLALLKDRLGPLSKQGVNVISDNDAEDLLSSSQQFMDVTPHKDLPPEYAAVLRPIHVRQLSNSMKHLDAITRAAASGGGSHALIVEDDALFSDTVVGTLTLIMQHIPADADIVFLGLPTPESSDGSRVVFHEATKLFKTVPACDSYIVSSSGAQKLAAAMLPIRFCTNVQLSYLIKTLGLHAYVSSPNVFIDGSKLGVYSSSIEVNNHLSWNQSYCKMAQASSVVEFDEIMAGQPFKEHPDVLRMKAAFLARQGRFREAREVYKVAFARYESDNVLMTDASDLLRGYMALYRHFQEEEESLN